MRKRNHIAKNVISLIFITVAIFIAVKIYNKYNYNDFEKNISELKKTEFTRDAEEKYSKMDSYKLENIDYTDSMFSQKISVLPNRPYKVTCKVKVKDVQNLNGSRSGGAHICISGTTEKSPAITGTSDWQDLTFYFNSKNRTEVNLGFRLGGYEEKTKGTAWFSDFEVKVGTPNSSNKWKMVCFIFPNIDVKVQVNNKIENVKLQMSENDIQTVKTNLSRFKNSISEICNNKMSIEYEVYTISEPIKTLSYDEENGYYVSAEDVYDYINSYIEKNNYDHIYVAFRMADKQKGNSTLVNDWIGLGGMDYYGIGFSNIRMPDDENNYAYEFNYLFNTFPEEVFIHEFLHTLERNSSEYGYEVPALHDYKNYGYFENNKEGLKRWYADYMNCNIIYQKDRIGLPSQIYTCKPVNESNFTYSSKVDVLSEPKNIIEVIRSIGKRVQKLFTYISEKSTDNQN